jgi:hypothetical protein
MSASMVVLGFSAFTACITFTQCSAPKSGKSSLSTEVITAWRSRSCFTERATFSGSLGSNGAGRPVFTWQNLQERVHVSPPTMKVAVPRAQHSPWLGHKPLAQMVCSRWVRTTSPTCRERPPCGNFIFSHSGFLLLSIFRFLCAVKVLKKGAVSKDYQRADGADSADKRSFYFIDS